jgi:hypothetical protein
MPKARLVDFRGGLNKKISPHMIGDTQGQAAKDVDLGSVRLQGRKALDTSVKATGEFYYDAGNSKTEGTWVSTDSTDGGYIANASDFSVWNKDLYVSINGGDGQIKVYRDGNTTAETLSFDPPTATTVTTSFPPNTLLFEKVDEVEGVPTTYTSTLVHSGNATSSWGTSKSSYSRATGTYTDTSSGSNGGTWYLWQKSGSVVTYYSRAQSTGGTTAICTQSGVGGTSYPAVSLTTENCSQYGFGYTAGETVGISGQTYYRWIKGSLTYYATSTSTTNSVPLYSVSGGPTQQGPNPSYYWEVTDTTTPTTLERSLLDAQSYWVAAEKVPSSYQWFVDNDWLYYELSAYARDTQIVANTQTTISPFVVNPQEFQIPGDTSGSTYQQGSLAASFVTVPSGRQLADISDESFSAGVGWRFAEYWEPFTQDTKSPSIPANATFWWSYLDATANKHYLRLYVKGEKIYEETTRPGDAGAQDKSQDYTVNGRVYRIGQNASTLTDFWIDLNGNMVQPHTYTHYLYKVRVGFKFEIKDITENYEGTTTAENLKVVWAGSTKYNQIVASNPFSITGNDGKTYRRTGSANSSNQWKVQQDGAYIRGSQASYTPPATPDAYTYTQIRDDLRTAGVDFIPETPAFYRDDARYYLYHVATSSDSSFSKAKWEIDQARGSTGDGWLRSGSYQRTISADDEGYFLKTVREQGDTTILPVLSQDSIKATLATSNSYDVGVANFLPRRLSFSITDATDSSLTQLGYQLTRVDSFGEVDLGYLSPDSTITLTESSNTLTLAGLTSTETYRLMWWCYQDTELDVAGSHKAKSNTLGIELTSKTSVALNLTKQDADRYAVDLWLERKVISSSSSAGEVWATVRCFDLWAYDEDEGVGATITGCDFLDVFANGTSAGALGVGDDETSPPKFLTFLRESNNFFYAVGTDLTADDRYVNATANKSDSYLFISRYNNPRDWPIDGFLEFDDSITGLHGYPGEMVVWTKSGTYRVFGSAHNQMRKLRLATTEGMPAGNHKSAVLVNNLLVWVSAAGICVYNGSAVTNLTRGRYANWSSMGSGVHAAQYDGQYYVLRSDETGYCVDFNLEGLPHWEVDLKEGGAAATNPVLVYQPANNRMVSRRGIVNYAASRVSWSYKSRGFDGGAFGSIKLVRAFTFNGTGSGTIQIYLDGVAAYAAPVTVAITQTGEQATQPARIYLPAAPTDNVYGLPVADVWDVEIVSWTGHLDWIDCDFEVLS